MNNFLQDMAVIDAHQHFWDPTRNYHPWLCDKPPIAFRYGDYSALRCPYLPDKYLRDATGLSIAGTVYIEAEWKPGEALAEMQYVEQLRKSTGYPSVAVAQAWLDQPDAATQLAQLARYSFVRGIRHKPRANLTPEDTAPGGMADPAWRCGYAHLAKHGLRFDLQTPWWHLHEATALARDFPGTQIILNHAALPADRTPAGLLLWRKAMKQVAGCPNVALKISGLGVPGQEWTAQMNREVVLAAIEIFGVDRCMFASNFPVDSLCGAIDVIFNGFAEIVHDFSRDERRKLFHDNAVRIYEIYLT
ncbi:MAG: amidohydrolase family protein [Pseudomonadota bacterium]